MRFVPKSVENAAKATYEFTKKHWKPLLAGAAAAAFIATVLLFPPAAFVIAPAVEFIGAKLAFLSAFAMPVAFVSLLTVGAAVTASIVAAITSFPSWFKGVNESIAQEKKAKTQAQAEKATNELNDHPTEANDPSKGPKESAEAKEPVIHRSPTPRDETPANDHEVDASKVTPATPGASA